MLTFRDYLLGLAAMEPCTQHGGAPAELRCRYIFCYYDENGDSQLDVSEFRFACMSPLSSCMCSLIACLAVCTIGRKMYHN